MQKRSVVSALAGLASLAAAPARAQNQPWANPNGSVESRVLSCTNPVPSPRIALDDFQFNVTTTINWIRWWGVVLDPLRDQLNKRFYVAIWSNGNGPCPAPCNSFQKIQEYCIDPSVRYAGRDCLDRRVYRFTSALAPAFVAVGGVKYWLQISEIDEESARPGLEDFRWSGFRQPRLCPAQMRDGAGIIACNINDDCVPPVATDLSYKLSTNCLGGVVVVPPVILEPHIFLLEIRPPGQPGSPPLVVEPLDPDSTGEYFLEHNLPDGAYELNLLGMGIRHKKATMMIQNGIGVSSFFDIFTGDLNNNGTVDAAVDVQLLVNGALAM